MTEMLLKYLSLLRVTGTKLANYHIFLMQLMAKKTHRTIAIFLMLFIFCHHQSNFKHSVISPSLKHCHCMFSPQQSESRHQQSCRFHDVPSRHWPRLHERPHRFVSNHPYVLVTKHSELSNQTAGRSKPWVITYHSISTPRHCKWLSFLPAMISVPLIFAGLFLSSGRCLFC